MIYERSTIYKSKSSRKITVMTIHVFGKYDLIEMLEKSIFGNVPPFRYW